VPVLNHHIVLAADPEASAHFYADVLGLPTPHRMGWFVLLPVSTDTTFFFARTTPPFDQQHYAFLVTDTEFDQTMSRVAERGLVHWADPAHSTPGRSNRWDDGRGAYFDDPDGHHLEVHTRHYGSGGTDAEQVHPLLSS
jgi:catechol 2,3-dioxygenase-like lactoylglutathione lyase family enzyme